MPNNNAGGVLMFQTLDPNAEDEMGGLGYWFVFCAVAYLTGREHG